MRDELPSDFPAALGSLGEANLPVIAPDLPIAKRSPAAPPTARAKSEPAEAIDLDLPDVVADLPAARPQSLHADLPATRPRPPNADLPARVADLPAAKRGRDLSDLPAIAASLPVSAAALPSVAAYLPSPAASLPVPAASLPMPAASLPMPAASLPMPAGSLQVPAASLPVTAQSLPVVAPGARAFGEIDLPTMDSLPPPPAGRPSPPPGPDLSGGFGEIDLPREAPASTPPLRRSNPSAMTDSADFADVQLEDRPSSNPPNPYAASRPPRAGAGRNDGGMSFGEVDLGGGGAGAMGSIGVEQSLPGRPIEASGGVEIPSMLPGPIPGSLRPSTARAPLPDAPARRSVAKGIAIGALVLAVLGGAMLHLTPYGAYGYLFIGDLLHAADYDRAALVAATDEEKAFGADTYDVARAGLDSIVAAHLRTPRARPLGALTALADYATSVRFGQDTARVSRAKQILSELPPNQPVKYVDVALAAQAADAGELDKSRAALDAASRRDAGGPLQLDIARLRGDIELAAKDGAAALVAFKRALELSNDARAHFGLARAYDLLADAPNARLEIDATLAASPQHPGALTLRARRKSARVDAVRAVADLAVVIDGPARTKASPSELSDAYAARAWVSLERGGVSEARDAFEQAVKLNPRNVEALAGEGRLLLGEGRYTEALARFDTALQFDPNSPQTIANDAEAKIALERLADAKQQLVAARERFPRSMAVLILLGKVEKHLGNRDAAEADLRAATAYVDPSRPDAVLPYIALSELLSERGHLSDARAILEDAKKKLPASSTLERAFGEVSELQGDYDGAIEHYRTALSSDSRDVTTHFRLGIALRRIRRFDDAGAELDKVAAVDKDYPGLSLERGLLFEEAGDVEKAIELFKGALAKAPDDPDLQLRVGSAYVAIGRPEDALPMLRKVLEKRPASAEAHHYMGRALMLQGGVSGVEALRYLKRAVELDPNRPEFHVYVAWAAADATPAQLELARDEVEKALSLDKVNAEAYWQRGVIERMTGAVDDAIKDEKHALELRPSRYEAHATLAECAEDKNDDRTAAAEWAKAIAGDGSATNADGTARHPYWRYRYGKLLLEHGAPVPALAQLVAAVTAAEKIESRPGWLGPLEFLAAEALRKAGRRVDAIEHYRRFLEIAPVSSPDRVDAQNALAQLSGSR
jgi:cellulose synthase operon protein C